MNVFVLCTGRSGSTAFMQACKHVTNFTCGHETRSARSGHERLNYAKWHIESDNRLSWFLGELDKKYGDKDVLYIHLKRDRMKTVRSYSDRWHVKGSILRAFSGGIMMRPPSVLSKEEKEQVCMDYYDCVNSNIELFLRDKQNKMNMSLENIKEDFKVFWELSGAEGDLQEALNEFEGGHNKGVWKKRSNYGPVVKGAIELGRRFKLLLWDLGIGVSRF